MKKLISTSIVLLCLGSVSFAQTAKSSAPTHARSKGAKATTAKVKSLKEMQISSEKNSVQVVRPEVALPVQKQN